MASLMLGSLDLLAEPYRAVVGTSWGEWRAITTSTPSLFVDGEVVSGEATGNQQIALRVRVQGASRPELIAACEALMIEANRSSNTLTFTPDDGLPVVYDVFRCAGPQRVDDSAEALPRRVYELSFPALPFARSATRELATATVPSAVIDSMESEAVGVVMDRRVGPDSNSYFWAPTTASPTVLADLSDASMSGSFSAVSGCTVSDATDGSTGRGVRRVTASAGGVVEVVSASSWSTSSDYVTVAVNAKRSGTTAGSWTFRAGVEWLDSGGASLRVDWGAPTAPPNGTSSAAYTIWEASKRPSGAAKVRARLQITAQTATETFDLYRLNVSAAAVSATTHQGYPVHDGSKAAVANIQAYGFTDYRTWLAAGFMRRDLPAAVDVSAQVRMLAWVYLTSGGTGVALNSVTPLSLRLWDATGKWSRYTMSVPTSPADAWVQIEADLASPELSSAAGAVDLTGVTGWDVAVNAYENAGPSNITDAFTFSVDTLGAAPAAAPNLSPRGTVLTLDSIKGSARSVARVQVSSVSALTDWIVAAIDGTEGEPLLAVTSNTATAAAPAGYSGVYSIVAAVTPATALASPTCTVTQKINGTTVATRSLTGVMRSGNHYCDFGAVELPLVGVPDDNQGVSYTFTLSPSSTAWVDLLVVDVDASLAWLPSLTTARKQGWVDEPEATAGLGMVWVGDVSDRSDARAPSNPPVLSRPFTVKAPSTRLLVYSTTTAPDVAVSYFARWLIEPTS